MVILLFPSPVQCAPGVVLDGSFGAKGALPGPNFIITAGMGKQAGGNLFQSFSSFNLTSSQSATFTATGSTGPINNILARVTGGSSSIDGAINSQIAGANLFLLNPSGVMFGAHAQVNVTGSFVVGTPGYLKLADGGKFNTSLGGKDNLTSAPVSAFGFLSSAPKALTMTGAQLTTKRTGTGFDLIGGDVTLSRAKLHAPSGNLTIFSAAGAGETPFSLSTPSAPPGSGYAKATNKSFGHILLQDNSRVDIDGSGGGGIVIRGGLLTMDNSRVESNNSGSIVGGDVSVQAEQITIRNAGQLGVSTTSTGNSGNVFLRANSLTINATGPAGQTALTGLGDQSGPGASGDAGAMTIEVSGAIKILGGGEVNSDTFSSGRGGDLTVNANTLIVDGSSDYNLFTGITSSADMLPGQTTIPTGNAGSVTVNVAGLLALSGGGEVFAGSSTAGKGGVIEVRAGRLTIDGTTSQGVLTGISSQSYDTGTGDAGSVTVDVNGLLTLVAGGEINSNTFTTAKAGSLRIHAGSVLMDGSATPDVATSISSASEAYGPGGDAGSMTINVDGQLQILGGAEIGVDTFTNGNAGVMTLNAGSVIIDGANSSRHFTGITSESLQGATGNAGAITVTSPGDITLSNDGSIKAAAQAANAGTVTLKMGGTLSLKNGSGISTSSNGDQGGDIALQVGQLVYLLNSNMEATASATPTGTGGNITIDPQFVVLDHSLISANAGARGGNITISSDFLFNSNSAITATGATQGTVTITAPDLNLAGSLLVLPTELVKAEKQLRERCARSLNHEFSSVIVVGRGGIEAPPDELRPDFGTDLPAK